MSEQSTIYDRFDAALDQLNAMARDFKLAANGRFVAQSRLVNKLKEDIQKYERCGGSREKAKRDVNGG